MKIQSGKIEEGLFGDMGMEFKKGFNKQFYKDRMPPKDPNAPAVKVGQESLFQNRGRPGDLFLGEISRGKATYKLYLDNSNKLVFDVFSGENYTGRQTPKSPTNALTMVRRISGDVVGEMYTRLLTKKNVDQTPEKTPEQPATAPEKPVETPEAPKEQPPAPAPQAAPEAPKAESPTPQEQPNKQQRYDDAISALVNLGISKKVAGEAVARSLRNHPNRSLEELIKLALRVTAAASAK